MVCIWVMVRQLEGQHLASERFPLLKKPSHPLRPLEQLQCRKLPLTPLTTVKHQGNTQEVVGFQFASCRKDTLKRRGIDPCPCHAPGNNPSECCTPCGRWLARDLPGPRNTLGPRKNATQYHPQRLGQTSQTLSAF